MSETLVGHLDTTFRGWSATLATRVRLVLSRLVLVFFLSIGLSRQGSGGQDYVHPWCSSWY